MTSIFPPILENRAPAIDYVGSAKDAETKTLDIHFMMPTLNGIGTNREIKNAQVVVRYKSNNQIALSPEYLPDRATLFFNIEKESQWWQEDETTGLCTLKVPYSCFIGGFPAYNTEYYVQVRFGDTRLWGDPSLGLWYGDLRNFAAWHSIQVNSVPSHFGEWSNICTVYCTRRAATSLDYNLDDYVPELVWEYRPSSGALDTLEQIQVQWEWDQDDRVTDTKHYVQSQVYTGARNESGNYTFRVKIPIAPVQTIYFFINAVTSHNVIYNDTAVLVVNPLNLPLSTGVDCHIKTKELANEENNDGIIAKEFYFNSPNSDAVAINLYRYNLNTLECVKIATALDAQCERHYIVKDYTVEMGEEYQYVACLVDKFDKVYRVFEKMTNSGEGTGGYGRLMNMEVSFLTTRHHQLRLHGGVSISSFKRNVSETFQTTIGSKYPYFSKNGAQNYRSFQLQATISINFDPTFAFVRLRDGIGATWDDADTSTFLFGEKDIFGEEQFSLSRTRVGYPTVSQFDHDLENFEYLYDTKPRAIKQYLSTTSSKDQRPELKQLQYDYEGDAFGPKTIYSPYLHKRTTTNVGTAQQNETIFLERKFREKVMSWLSDGKPKLYRSETEGNMIVMVSGATFTPVQKTQRLIYSVSCTITEIAEYNLENLIQYDLIPSEIISNYSPTGEWDFNPGDYDPMLDHKLKFNVLSRFRIPDTQQGATISTIDLRPGIVNGIGPYTFKGGTGSQQELIPGVILSTDGEIFGRPTTPGDSTTVAITVTDSNPKGKESVTFNLPIGKIYPPIEINTTRADGLPIMIDGVVVGTQIAPVNIGLNPKAKGEPPYTWYATGLPDGLMMKMVGEDNKEVVISGTFVYEIQSGTFTLIVEDAYGQTNTAQIPYGTSLSELRYLYDSSWDKLEEMEEGTALKKPIDFGNTVVGGVKPFTFKMDPIPKGLSFDVNTGRLSGTPEGDTYPVHSTKTTLTVKDATGQEDSVEMVMPTIYSKFVFESHADILNFFKPADNVYFSTGTIFKDLDLMSLFNADDETIVHGGKPNSDGWLPAYTFQCIADTGGILENFGVSTRGVLFGYTVSSHPAGNITIMATDARGITVSRSFAVPEVRGQFTITRQPSWSLPEMPISTPLPEEGWLTIAMSGPGFSNNGGAWEDYVVTANGLPPGMTITQITENGGGKIRITGRLTGESPAGSVVINITDGYGQEASVTIPCGAIYDTVQWRDDDSIKIGPAVEYTRLSSPWSLPKISGGMPPYSIVVVEGELSPYTLTKTQNITGSDVVMLMDDTDGVGAAAAPRKIVLKAKDARGTTSPQSVIITINEIYKNFSVTVNSMPVTYLMVDTSALYDGDFQIATVTGGSGNFTYRYKGKTEQVLSNGLTLKANGCLVGTPRVAESASLIEGFEVVDNVSNKILEFSFRMPITIPIPTPHPQIAAKFNSDDEYPITGLAVKKQYKSDYPLFDIPISGATITGSGVPDGLNVDANYYLMGSPAAPDNGPIHCSVKAILQGNVFTPQVTTTVKLYIDRISGVLNFKWSPTDAGNQGALAINKPFSLLISEGASGGALPYTWTITENPGVGLSLQSNADGTVVTLKGTPTVKKEDPFTYKIELKDANGTTLNLEVLFNGVYDELKFNGSGLSIPSVDGKTAIDTIDLVSRTSGGKPPYSFYSIDLAKWGYQVNQGEISGVASTTSVDAGKALITITDSVGQVVTFELQIGAIKGIMGLKQTEYIVPQRTKGSTFSTINLQTFIVEGTGNTKKYDLSEEIPSGWAKEGTYGIELTTDGRITGKYPNQTINTEMSFTVRITDTDATVQVITIKLPKVS